MNEIHYLERALGEPNQSGKSQLVTRYERTLAQYFGAGYCVALNSGSAAIEASLLALGAGVGRSVLVSAAAPLPTLMPIIATGSDLVFVDSMLDSPSLDSADLARCLDDSVVAAVEVPLWGYPLPNALTRAVLQREKIPLLEDSSHAHGATVDGQFVGTFGEVGCFSTHQMKPLSTGEGGFILTDSVSRADFVRRYSRIGALDGITFGRNFKPSAFTAAVGLARLPDLSERNSLRRRTAEAILRRLPERIRREVSFRGDPNGYSLVINVDDPDLGSAFHEELAAVGIRTDIETYGYRVGYQHAIAAKWARRCPNAEFLIPSLVQISTDGDADDTARRVAAAWRRLEGPSLAPTARPIQTDHSKPEADGLG